MSNHDVSPEPEGELSETISTVVRILVRRRWWILLTGSCTTLAAIAAIMMLPNRYRSEATLLVVQQQVPQRYVVPTTTTSISDALQAMTQEVLSRRRLLSIIDEVGLYRKQRSRFAAEELVGKMLEDIEIQPLEKRQQDFNAFRISFVAEDPRLAQRVTSTLTSLFIQENLRTREEQATTTTNFLHEQVEAKRIDLERREERLRNFKMTYLGELPEQQQGNLGILVGLQSQLQSTMAGIARAQQQKVYLESLLAAQRQIAARASASAVELPAAPGAPAEPGAVAAAVAEISRLESEKAALLSRYTADHPDVEKTNRELAAKQAELAVLKRLWREALEAAGKNVAADAARPAGRAEKAVEDMPTAQLRSQLEANAMELGNLVKDESQLKASVSQYQQRLNMTPVREQELAAIVRETEAARQEYADLQRKEQESQLSRNLEKNQRGQQFRLVDAPSFPTVPASPKRLKLSGSAAAAGFGLGLLLAFALEFRQQSFQTEKQVRALFPPGSFVVALPVLTTRREQRIRRWRMAGEWSAGTVLAGLLAAAEFYVYRCG